MTWRCRDLIGSWWLAVSYACLILLALANGSARAWQEGDDGAEVEAGAEDQPGGAEDDAEGLDEAIGGQDDPGGQDSNDSESDSAANQNVLFWLYDSSGIFFFIQLPISIILVGMIIMYGMQVMRNEFLPPQFVIEFEEHLKEKRYQQAYDLAKENPSLVARVVTAGLARLSTSSGYAQALEAMQEVGEDEGMKFDHRLSYLAMLGNVATMVGLLGTVSGMVAAFLVIAQSNTTPKPSELAEGVSQALVTTVWGLSQAIPAVIAHTIFKNRVARLMLEVGITSERLMNRFSSLGAGRSTKTGVASGSSASGLS